MDSRPPITDWLEVQRLLEEHERQQGNDRHIDPIEMAEALKARVRGQDHVIDHLATFTQRQWAMKRRWLPIACVVFVGPPATGKTELARTIAEHLYDSPEALIHIKCPEYKDGQMAMASLVGSDGVFKGSRHGKLTQPVISDPRRVILFDEIEKAWDGIYDIFLNMFEGSLTDHFTRREADFTQSIIILTSNIDFETLTAMQEHTSDPDELDQAVRQHLSDISAFRPEIISRFDRLYVFKPLAAREIAEIAGLKMIEVADSYGLELAYVDPRLVVDLTQNAGADIRQLRRAAVEMLADVCIPAQQEGATCIRLEAGDAGEIVVKSVDAINSHSLSA